MSYLVIWEKWGWETTLFSPLENIKWSLRHFPRLLSTMVRNCQSHLRQYRMIAVELARRVTNFRLREARTSRSERACVTRESWVNKAPGSPEIIFFKSFTQVGRSSGLPMHVSAQRLTFQHRLPLHFEEEALNFPCLHLKKGISRNKISEIEFQELFWSQK